MVVTADAPAGLHAESPTPIGMVDKGLRLRACEVFSSNVIKGGTRGVLAREQDSK